MLRVSQGGTMLLDAPAGMSLVDATSTVQAALGATVPGASCRDAREVLMQVNAESPWLAGGEDAETSPLLELARGQANIVCSAEDWIPGIAGNLALAELHRGQHCFVRVQSELGFGTVGLPDFGIPPNTSLEYEVELLAIMTFEDVSLDKSGNVMKKTIREGDGYDRPEEGAEVTVSCEAHDDDTGAVLFEEQSLVFHVANGRFCSALEETVLTMKKGEVCEVRCSTPSVCTDVELTLRPGASAIVVFSLELKEFEKIALHGLPDAERVARCAARKEVGAKFFKEGNWSRALKRYTYTATCLRYLDHWLDAAAKAEALKLRRVSNANAAACHLKLEAWQEASTSCGLVLKEEPDNVKALFRRGHARVELGEYREAYVDLRKVLELDRENREAARLLAKAKQFMKSEVANEKKMFSKMVAGSKSSPSGSSAEKAPQPSSGEAKPQAASSSSSTGQLPAGKATAGATEDREGLGDVGDLGDDSCLYMVGAAALLAAGAASFLWSTGRLPLRDL